MQITECVNRRRQAAVELAEHEAMDDGTRASQSLSDGLTTLRNLLYKRLHDDFEQFMGTDSMIMPVSNKRTEKKTKLEIELYQIVVSAVHAGKHQYVSDTKWYLTWLSQMRLGDSHEHEQIQKRMSQYLKTKPAERRLIFTNVLVKTLREAGRAPLVLFRLFPLSVAIATSVAFGDQFEAAEIRNRQVSTLPSIADCHDCHGRPLDNGEICPLCGNPLWSYKWLTAPD